MTKQEIISLIVVLWSAGILTAIARVLIKLAKAHVKDKNTQMFLGWVEQAVMYAEKNFVGSETKKQEAVSLVAQRIRKNKLVGRFSQEQIEGAIELAVQELTNSTTGLSKPVIKTETKEIPVVAPITPLVEDKEPVLDNVATYTLEAE